VIPPQTSTTGTLDAEVEDLAPAREGEAAVTGPRAPLSNRVTVIKPPSKWLAINFRELWAYRELASTFAWRDFKVRYKQAYLGILWAVVQPFGQMVVAVVIFGKFAHFPADGPYPVFVYSALMLWGYFTGAITRASNSLVGNITFVTKIYFPRVLLPLSAVVSPLVDFCFSSLVIVALMAYYHVVPGLTLLAVPIVLLLTMLTALGAGLFLSAINVRYRDVPYTLPYLIMMWTFLSPVYYTNHGLPHRWQLLASLNPMAGVLGSFRWAVIGAPLPPISQLGTSLAMMVATLAVGLVVFKRQEPRFADNI
jgi:lipopolysaccharide transport system permease protein